jgi:hypothetical protein
MTFEAAQMGVIKKLVNNGFQLISIFPLNRRRYSIITSPTKKILLTFKREPFHTFGFKFKREYDPQSPETNEEGDTINLDDLNVAIKMGVTEIYSVFANGVVYKISIEDFLEKAERWRCSEGKRVLSLGLDDYEIAFDLKLK